MYVRVERFCGEHQMRIECGEASVVSDGRKQEVSTKSPKSSTPWGAAQATDANLLQLHNYLYLKLIKPHFVTQH